MKKIITVFILFAQLSITIAQEYTPFPLENSVWVGRHYNLSFINNWQINISSHDTIINGTVYKKIEKKGIQNNITAIREKDKIVYLREGNKDTILYDFNIKTGDTLNGRFYGFRQPPFNLITVKSTDSVLINNKYRKRYYLLFDGIRTGELVEGMGCTCGFIPYVLRHETGGFLDCHSTNDKVIFGSGTNGKCDLLMSNKDASKRLPQVQIYPNPVTDMSLLKIPDDILSDKISVFDVLGRLVKTYTATDNAPEILKNDYSEGIYFVHILHQNHVIALSKFIVN